jgi:crotonobetainyl-CoA:carnitine CoA-transferase CaiB-like acyl-CoA transferase
MFDLLKGLKVVDLTTIVLGPYATQFLGDLGADVIKVEAPAGDIFRAVRPGRRDDLGAAFLNFNRNKRSIAVDLKQDRGRKVLHDLVGTMDVFVHNMRLSSAAAMGASYEELALINPSLVYCYSPGYGARGPDRETPAYDDTIQARSGLVALNADTDGDPQFVRTIVCDKVVGLHLALAVVSGVVRRAKTGRGVCIEAPMFESMASFLLAEHMAGHTFIPAEGELGYGRVMSPNRKPYRTKDGYIAVLPYSTKHWIRFFELNDRADLVLDPKVTDPVQRSEHIDELYGVMAELVLTKTTREWHSLLSAQDIPCSTINSLEDLIGDPHLQAADMFPEVEDTRVGSLKMVRSPFEVDGELSDGRHPNAAAPGLGEHTREVLGELNYTVAEIEALVAGDVVVANDEGPMTNDD